MGLFRVFIFLFCCVLAHPASAKIYQWVDENGRTQYTNYPPPVQSTEVKNSIATSSKTQISSPKLSAQQNFSYSDIPIDFDISDGVTLRIRRMLEMRNYEALNRLLHKYQLASEKNPLAEDILFAGYSAFGKNDSGYESLLTDWISAFPKIYQPYLARAEYYCNAAWNARGTNWASETSQEQFQGMTGYFEKARKDLDSATSLYDKTIVPHHLLLNMANAQGNNAEIKNLLDAATEISPATYKIRASYMLTLTPRWGGSYEAMETFANDSVSYTALNPKMHILPGLMYDDQALVMASLKKFNVAEQVFTKALSYGENHVIFFHRGRTRYKNENYVDALTDLDKAIEIYKDDSDYYYWRAMTYSKMEQYDKAVGDINSAEALENNNKYYKNLREFVATRIALQAHESNKNENASDAISKYDTAIGLEPNNAIIRYNKAITLYDNNRLDEAFEELKKAIELDPNEINYYVAIDTVLAQNRDWDKIIGYWDDFLFNHPNNSRGYLERAGAYHQKGDETSAISDLETAANLGNQPATQLLKRYGRR